VSGPKRVGSSEVRQRAYGTKRLNHGVRLHWASCRAHTRSGRLRALACHLPPSPPLVPPSGSSGRVCRRRTR
jgi:hypothetical protein